MRDIFTWLLRLCKWSAEPRELWLCIAGVIAAIGLFLIVSHSRSDAFRYAGLMLQVMGVLRLPQLGTRRQDRQAFAGVLVEHLCQMRISLWQGRQAA